MLAPLKPRAPFCLGLMVEREGGIIGKGGDPPITDVMSSYQIHTLDTLDHSFA